MTIFGVKYIGKENNVDLRQQAIIDCFGLV